MSIAAARHQWEDGKRRLADEGEDTARARHLGVLVEAVVHELQRRVGQTFTLRDLADAYGGAEDWVREVIVTSAPPRSRERRSGRVLRWLGALLLLGLVFFVGLAVGRAVESAPAGGDQTLVRTLVPVTLTPRETVTVTVSNP